LIFGGSGEKGGSNEKEHILYFSLEKNKTKIKQK
jgi:hypothetical protein